MNIYLSIGEVKFTISYKKKEVKFFQPLINDIYTNYKFFLKPSFDKKKSNFFINISHVNKISLHVGKDGYNSVVLFKKKSDNVFETYSYISFVQLTTIVLRGVRSILDKNSGFILHASANIINNKAVIFLGRSGAGKSTIARLLRDSYPIIADDNIIIRYIKGTYYVFQSPLLQKFPRNEFKKPIEISKIYFLKKSNSCSSKVITDKSVIFKKMLEYLWVEKDTLSTSAKIMQQFNEHFASFYLLRFPNNKEKVIDFFGKNN